MAIQLGSAYGKVVIDSSGVSVGVGNATKSLGSLTAIAGQVGGAMKNIGAAMTLGLTLPIAAFFASSMKSAMAAENALAEVNAVLASTGGVAGVTAEEVQKLASEFQKLTKFSDEQIMSGESMLLTFTNISSEVFPQATEAMLNMAEKFGNIENASIQLGKALNDPIAGVGALRRVGVMLSQEQENQIKAFMAVNDIASAQKVILQELQTEFGGLAVAMGKTDSGKLAQFINTLDDFKELIGKDLIKAFIPFIEMLTVMMQKFMDLPEPTRNAIVKIVIALGGLAAIAGPIIFALGSLISMISGIVTIAGSLGISMSAVAAGAGAAGSALVGLGFSALLLLGQLLLLAAGPVLLYLAFKNNFMGITDTVKQLWFIIKHYFGLMVNWIRDSFMRIRWGDIGKFMVSGIANGMLGGIPSLVMAATKVAAAALDTIKKKLGISSPSLEFMKLGAFSGQGFQMGLANTMDPNVMARAMAKPVQNMSSSQSSSNVFHLSGGLTIRDVDRLMDEKINRFAGRLEKGMQG